MSTMTFLNRETLGAELRGRLIERYGTLSNAANALNTDVRDLYRAYSKHGNARESLTVPLRFLKRLGYDVRFEVIAKKERENAVR